ncbi:site-specific DNA-methyltransferase [Mycobacterium phage Brujita]|uniref:DNA methylase n=2 Tax=Brujitavirus brujita TaxID=561996 RepID=B5U3C3_9CAUD|nr:site-specific DNA-methyltransferase [Mycobacterium phage Brujita]ACI06269.1 DNA methylase [Mycobacterium phage Brujita]ADL71237.1 DNA methylase [Mycobacterium phage Island3]
MKPYYSDDHVTLYHGDCREIDAWEAAHLLLTDPPYGIDWPPRTGTSRHQSIANDSDTAARDYVIGRWGHVKPAYVFGSPLLAPPYGTKQTLVWRKPGDSGLTGQIGGWRRDWEAIYMLGNWPRDSRPLRSGIITTNVGMSTYQHGHAHGKPVALLEVLLLAAPGGAVADPFAGSGSTLLAARNVGRKAIGVEYEERYCEIIARRLDQMCLDLGEGA